MLVIGSRGSKLALWQAEHVAGRLNGLGFECRIEVIQTSGDRFQSGPLKSIGNKGLFTKEIEEALLQGRIDLAVHSLKDMPAHLPEGLLIAATPEREDVRDALVGARLDELPSGARVGTGSIRRVAQLSAHRPDLQILPIRGNVDTRLRKLDDGEFDAIVLASAGLHRLGWSGRITEYLNVDIMCPAVGQGSLAIETRADDGAAYQACLLLNHPDTNSAVTAERALLSVLGGGCQVPVGAHGDIRGEQLHLSAVVISPEGAKLVRFEGSAHKRDAVALGESAGKYLLEHGGREILETVYSSQ